MNRLEKKILIVDDEPISLKILGNFLQEAKVPFEQANNGKDALSLLNEHPDHFCAVVMDRYMPWMSGLEVLRVMQQTDALRAIPVVMLTGLTEKEDVIEAIKAGAFDYLSKPVEKDLVIKLIERAREAFGT